MRNRRFRLLRMRTRSYPRMRTDAVTQLNRLELNHEKRTHDAGSNPQPLGRLKRHEIDALDRPITTARSKIWIFYKIKMPI